jgi:hypothetical protein
LVLSAVSGAAKGATDGMIDKNGARRRDMGHDVQGRSNNQSRDVMAFDDMGDETDGLVAEGSIGDQQSKVNAGLLQLPSNRWGEFVFDLLMPPNTAHKRNVNGGQASHDLLGSETCQTGHGKNDFRILAWHRANARVVIDHNLACLGIGRNEPVAQVFARCKRFLTVESQCGTRQKRDA